MSYSLTEKEAPVDADEVIIKDSEDGGAVKCIQLVNMPKGKVEQVLVIDGYRHLIGGNQSGWYSINNGDATITATENYGKLPMPACNITAIQGRCDDASSEMTLTVRKNGADTGLTGTVSATGKFDITAGGPVSFADGDEFSLAFSCAGGGGWGGT